MTPIAQMSLCHRSEMDEWIGVGKGAYTGLPCPVFLKISGAMYPGVPHVVVKT